MGASCITQLAYYYTTFVVKVVCSNKPEVVYSTSWMPAVFCQLAYFRSLVWKFATFVQKVVVLLLKKSVLSVRTGFFLSCAPAVFCQLGYIYATFVVKVVGTFCSKKWFAQINLKWFI